MDAGRLEGNQREKEEGSSNDAEARLSSSGLGDRTRPDRVIEPLNIREAIEVMKILAPVAQDVMEAEKAVTMVRIIFEHFEETDPTQTLRLASLFYHEPVDTLAETLVDVSGEDFFGMMIDAFVENSLADLVETVFALGFAKKRVSDAG